LVAQSIERCTALLQTLLASPGLREKLSRNARRHVAAVRTPERSAEEFTSLWRAVLGEPVRRPNFPHAIGATPADWFLATQCFPGEAWESSSGPKQPSKGMLAHFVSTFPNDASLSRLADTRHRAVR